MSRQPISIESIAAFYSGADPGLTEEDPGSDAERCTACGALLPEQGDELFAAACPACGRQVEANE